MTEVLLHVAGYPDSDDDERAELAARLREEIDAQGVGDVAHPSIRPPPGAKGPALEWAQLALDFAGTAGPLITALLAWRGRHPRAAVTLQIGGDSLTLDEAAPEDQRRLVETFLARHGA
jgi:hypothetical protein